MLSIRFQRTGKKKSPHYRMVVTEKTRDPWGKHTDIIGHYNPRTKEAVLKEDRVQHWLSVGAQPTNSVRNMLINQGLMKGDKAKAVLISKKRQAKLDEKKAEAAEAKKAAEEAAAAEAEAKKAEEEAAKAAEAEAKAAEEAAVEAPAEEAPEEPTTEDAPEEAAPAEDEKKEEAPAEEAAE